MRRHPRRQERQPLPGPGASPPGCAPVLRRRRQGRGHRPHAPARPRIELYVRRLPERDRLPRIEASPSFVRQPEGNGVAERFIRTLKENLLWVRHFETIEALRLALLDFAAWYNTHWLVARHGHRTPAQVRADQQPAMDQAA